MNAAKKVERLRKQLTEAVNGSELPAIVAMMVIKEIYQGLEALHQRDLAAPEEENG